jgi:hypothetical protein
MRQLLDFTDTVVLVTGGATGIGRAVSLAFAEQGASASTWGRTHITAPHRWGAELRGRHETTVEMMTLEVPVDMAIVPVPKFSALIASMGSEACDRDGRGLGGV